jgi:hypothetical protein
MGTKPHIFGFALVLAAAGVARGERVFIETDFTNAWVTTPRVAEWQVSGARVDPDRYYRVTHTHRPLDPFAPSISSLSLSTGDTSSISTAGPYGRLRFSLELRVDPGSDPTCCTDLSWAPVLVQDGRTFISRLVDSLGSLDGSWEDRSLVLGRDDFLDSGRRPNFSAGAPGVRFGVLLYTRIPVSSTPRTVFIGLDTVLVEVIAPGGAGLEVTDHDHVWGADPTIPYEITVTNFGPERSDLVLTLWAKSENYRLAPETVRPPWNCNSDFPPSHVVCTLALGVMPSGSTRTLTAAGRTSLSFFLGEFPQEQLLIARLYAGTIRVVVLLEVGEVTPFSAEAACFCRFFEPDVETCR